MIGWPPRDLRALVALIFSVLGAAVLTAFVWWGYAQLLPNAGWSIETESDRAHTLRWVLWIATGSIGVVLIGLGMAINRRRFSGNIGTNSVSFEGGDDAPAAANAVADAARDKAEEIEERQ